MSKKQQIIDYVNAYANQYPTMKLTVRQVYYRLVSKQILKNTINEYKYTSSALTDARKNFVKGINPTQQVDWRIIEDRGRTVIIPRIPRSLYWTPKKEAEYYVEDILDKEYTLPKNLYQPDVVVVLLEKKALEGIFTVSYTHLRAHET